MHFAVIAFATKTFNMKSTLYSNLVWPAPNSNIWIRQIWLAETGGKILVRNFSEDKSKKDKKNLEISMLSDSRPSKISYRVLLFVDHLKNAFQKAEKHVTLNEFFRKVTF